MKLNLVCLLSIVLILNSCMQKPNLVKPLPTERQLKWHEMEYYAFVHFNMNTFTDEEWGFGHENPNTFNPTNLDCEQWVKTIKQAGMKGVLITAKHHDGFCLWPTKTTEHSVKNSPYKNGKGDIVKELSEACAKYDIKFGVYLSPWDRNSAYYGEDRYIKLWHEQLRELLTNYGEVFEVWFDGANGGSGYYGGKDTTIVIDHKTYYQWDKTIAIVRKLQPNAVIFGDGGPGVRWVGNEHGEAGETNWSIIRAEDCYAGMPNHRQLMQGHEDGNLWAPAECDVSIRPGWYYHKREDHQVKSIDHLVDIYYKSVGRNASLLLNFPITPEGLIHKNDSARVMELKRVIDNDLEENLIKHVVDAKVDGKLANLTTMMDDNMSTYFMKGDSAHQIMIELTFDELIEINRFLIQEYIAAGQRIKKFEVNAWIDDQWHNIASETTIGAKRILRFPTIKTNKLQLHIIDSKDVPVLSNVALYHAPVLLSQPTITRDVNGLVTIKSTQSNALIKYVIDNVEADYNEPFLFTKGKIAAFAYDVETHKKSEIIEQEFDIIPSNWKVISGNENVNAIFDGNINTTYKAHKPHELVIDLGETINIAGFKYTPDQDRWGGGYAFGFEFYISDNNKNWGEPVIADEFGNIENSPIEQVRTFTPKKGRYIKLFAKTLKRGQKTFNVAEFSLITTK